MTVHPVSAGSQSALASFSGVAGGASTDMLCAAREVATDWQTAVSCSFGASAGHAGKETVQGKPVKFAEAAALGLVFCGANVVIKAAKNPTQ